MTEVTSAHVSRRNFIKGVVNVNGQDRRVTALMRGAELMRG